MPLKGKINFGETGRITSVNLSMFYNLLWKAIRKKLKLVDGCPRAMLYNNSYKLGFGINDLEAIYHTAKIEYLLHSLQTDSKFCRLTTLWTLLWTYRGIHIINGTSSLVSYLVLCPCVQSGKIILCFTTKRGWHLKNPNAK